MKKRVKFLDSIAVLADPKSKNDLDAKYARITEELKGRQKPPTPAAIKNHIEEMKKADRYGETLYGFQRDMGFKPDQEALINADLAEKWEDAGICQILTEAKK